MFFTYENQVTLSISYPSERPLVRIELCAEDVHYLWQQGVLEAVPLGTRLYLRLNHQDQLHKLNHLFPCLALLVRRSRFRVQAAQRLQQQLAGRRISLPAQPESPAFPPRLGSTLTTAWQRFTRKHQFA